MRAHLICVAFLLLCVQFTLSNNNNNKYPLPAKGDPRGDPFSIPREFANICAERFWHFCYNQSAFTIAGDGLESNYKLGSRIGRGKFSVVYSATDRKTKETVAVKFIIYPDGDGKKLQSELKLLATVSGGPAIIKLLDFVPDWGKSRGYNNGEGFPAIITEYIPGDTRTYREVYAKLSDWHVRFLYFELLQALHFTHSQGIVHKDIKPLNVAIDLDKMNVRLLDWGSAGFFHEGKIFGRGGGTKGYKPPEMLMNRLDFTYAYDMWCFGLLVAGTIFKIFPLWNKPVSDERHFERMVTVLGKAGLTKFIAQHKRNFVNGAMRLFINASSEKGEGWGPYIDSDNMNLISMEALDLISRLLVWDPNERLTATEALEHPYFAPIKHCLTSVEGFHTPVPWPDTKQVPSRSRERRRYAMTAKQQRDRGEGEDGEENNNNQNNNNEDDDQGHVTQGEKIHRDEVLRALKQRVKRKVKKQ